MANINDIFPSNYLKVSDLQGTSPTLTIERVTVETLGQGDDSENKPVLYFVGKEKGLVCNKTNCITISQFYGPETDDWKGKLIRLIESPVSYQGKTTMALRIHPEKPVA